MAETDATIRCLEIACAFALAGAVTSVSRGAFRLRP
jgi:hypothetical protein